METTQIIEILKSLDLNINSETALMITKEVMSYFWAKMIINGIGSIIALSILAIIAIMLIKFENK